MSKEEIDISPRRICRRRLPRINDGGGVPDLPSVADVNKKLRPFGFAFEAAANPSRCRYRSRAAARDEGQKCS